MRQSIILSIHDFDSHRPYGHVGNDLRTQSFKIINGDSLHRTFHMFSQLTVDRVIYEELDRYEKSTS